MTARRFIVAVLCLLVLGLAPVPAVAGDPDRERAMDRDLGARAELAPNSLPVHLNFIANAFGFQEVPAVITPGRANLRARLSEGGNSIEYRLSYDLQGDVRSAHIHVGQAGVNGAAVVVLCSNQPTAGSSAPPCPGPSIGAVSGVLLEQDIIGGGIQGVDSLESLVVAMMARVTYVNVQSHVFPGGEVRAQITRLHLNGGGPGSGSEDDSGGDGW